MFKNTCLDFAAHRGDLSAVRMSCCTWPKFAALRACFSPSYHIHIRNSSPFIYLQLQLAVTIKVFLRYIKLCGVVREALSVADVR
ncbi:MAG: hypothetical protein RL392_60 [Pseudomonadota bacterium]|jgi:hypothetical protein